MDTPVAIGSLREYEATFGAPSAASGLGLAVRDFFAEGGRHAVALRIGERGLDALGATEFTLLCLTPTPAAGDVAEELWSAALAVCAERHALLLAHPPRDATAAGALARIDARHGVWHAPAGAEATLAARPAAILSGAENEALRPVNALRACWRMARPRSGARGRSGSRSGSRSTCGDASCS